MPDMLSVKHCKTESKILEKVHIAWVAGGPADGSSDERTIKFPYYSTKWMRIRILCNDSNRFEWKNV